jgi:hypothetical protein
MRPGRTLLALAAVAAGLGIGIPLLSNSLHKLGAQGWFDPNATKGGLIQPATPTPHTTPVTGLLQPPTPTPAPARKPAGTPTHAHPAAGHDRRPVTEPGSQPQPSSRPAPPRRQPPAGAHPNPPTKRPSTTTRPISHSHGSSGGAPGDTGALLAAGLEILAGIALAGALAVALLVRRTRRRSRREYGLYELHLSTHDQAKGQDLEDMVESIANIVRAWPADRVRHGQPYLALELICGGPPRTGGEELEWSINVRCEPKTVAALDGAISAAYPDVRLGRAHGEQPRPRAGGLSEPGYLMRFRKERSFVYSLIADGEEQASSPLEQIARSQIAAGAPSIVRFQLTPTPSSFEELARRLYRRHENKLVRQERWGLPEGGLSSTFNRAEMRAAERTQNRSLFWRETVIAADTREVCKTVAAAVQSRRGENRLHRRWMIIRQRLYRRRFPRALGPLIPSFRTLVSAAEVAHLLELPSARMKGVPVRRVTIPRIPAPPEVGRGRRTRTHVHTPTDRSTNRRAPGPAARPALEGERHT